MSEELQNVVPMNAEAARDLEIRRASKPEKSQCNGQHMHIEVDAKDRLVRCLDCEHLIDPFDFLERCAMEGDLKINRLKNIEVQTRITKAEFDDLTRKVGNLRQVLKRAGQPQPQVERDHYNSMRWNPHLVQATP